MNGIPARYRCTHPVARAVLVAVAGCLLCTANGYCQPPSLDELVEANQQMIEALPPMELVLTHTVQDYKGDAPFGQSRDVPDWTWARSGARERMRYSDGRSPQDGRPQDLYDWFSDGESLSLLRNWNPESPQVITPIDQGSVIASVMPPTQNPLGRDAPRFLLWGINAGLDDRAWTLRDIVKASPDAEVVGPAVVDGHNVWHLKFSHPDEERRRTGKLTYDVFIDPALNFSIRRVSEHQHNVQKNIDGALETYTLKTTRTARSHKDLGMGAYVPVEVEMIVDAATSDRRKSVTITRVRAVKTGPVVDQDALAFRFPKDVLVRYDPPLGPSKRKVVLWGPDNKPAKEIGTPHDIPGFDELRRQTLGDAVAAGDAATPHAQDPRSGARSVIVWINIAVLLAAIGAIAWRVKHRGSQAKGESQ
jgi:hypothetical protein